MDTVKILSIDRDQKHQGALTKCFAGHGRRYDLTPVATFTEAMNVMADHAFDLILFDIAGENPAALTSLLELQNIPKVALTGQDNLIRIISADKGRVAGYILKDKSASYLSTLAERVDQAVRDWKSQANSILYQEQLDEITSAHAEVLDDLKESREIYRQFFQTARDAIFITATDGRWIDMNTKALDLFGYFDREQIWSDSILNLFRDPDELPKISGLITRNGSLEDHLVEFKKKGGSSFTALVSAVPFKIQGKTLGYQGFIRDVTADIRSQETNSRLLDTQAAVDAIAVEMGTSKTLEETYQKLSRHLKELFAADAIVIYKLDPVRNQVREEFAWWAYSPGQNIPPQARLDRMGSEILNQIIHTHSPAVVDLSASPEAFADSLPLTTPEEEGHASGPKPRALTAPVVLEGQMIALIEVIRESAKPWSAEDLSLAARIATVVSIGLQKAYLIQETQSHVKKLAALQRIQRTVLENLSLPTTLDQLVEDLVRELRGDAADILYMHPSLNTLELIAQTGFRQKALQQVSLQIGEGLAGQAAADRRRVHVPDLRQLTEGCVRHLEFAAEHFVSYYGVPLLAKDRFVGVLEIYQRSPFAPAQDWLDLLDMLAGLVAVAIDLHNLYSEMENSRAGTLIALDSIIERWAEALELRGVESPGHWRRIEKLSLLLAKKMGCSGEEMTDIRRGTLLHDVGKMTIPDHILQKGSQLSAQEWKLIGRHPVEAYELLRPVDALKAALDIPLCHHERWDGKGYPHRMKGEEIPLAARIFAIVDVWDAMQSDRPYRKALTREEALEHIKNQSGKHFDPKITGAFLELIAELAGDLQKSKIDEQRQLQVGISESQKLPSAIPHSLDGFGSQ